MALMTTTQPTLTDPDKLGLLINLRQKMDELKPDKLCNYGAFILESLSAKQLKNFLFIGLNEIKTYIEYNQLSQMKSRLNEMIEQENQSKKKCKPDKDTDTKYKPTIPIISKNASLTKVIPFNIISNYICHFLKMSSITKLAQCDRKLAIICHTPTSIKNLKHRYDPYPYIDGYYHTTHTRQEINLSVDGYYRNMKQWTSVQTMHRFRNVEQLAMSNGMSDQTLLFNALSHVKHLYLHSNDQTSSLDFSKLKMTALLETICIVGYYYSTLDILHFMHHHSKHKLKSIVLIDNCFHSVDPRRNHMNPRHMNYIEPAFEHEPDAYKQYRNMHNFLLPLQPNNLEILKFEHSFFIKSYRNEYKETNAEYRNIGRIKQSLANLKGFVYSESGDDNGNNIFYTLSHTILSNLILFKKLQSLHTHFHGLLSLYLNSNSISALNNISELCISVDGLSLRNHRLDLLSSLDLEKICIVININGNVFDGYYEMTNLPKYEKLVRSVLVHQKNLNLFQIVIAFSDPTNMNVSFCAEKIEIVTIFMTQLLDTFTFLQNIPIVNKKKPLLFKIHIKSCHSKTDTNKCTTFETSQLKPFGTAIQTMIVNYLMTYTFGKVQFKFSYNTGEHLWVADSLKRHLKGLNGLFNVVIKSDGSLGHLKENIDYCCNDMDFKQFAISVTKQNVSENIEYEKKWKVDCRYCCNTPWV